MCFTSGARPRRCVGLAAVAAAAAAVAAAAAAAVASVVVSRVLLHNFRRNRAGSIERGRKPYPTPRVSQLEFSFHGRKFRVQNSKNF